MDRLQTPAKPGGIFFLGRIHFSATGKHTLEFIILAIWVRLALGWGYRKWQWEIQADIRQATLKGGNFRCIGGVLEAWLEDMGMRTPRIVLVGLEWSGTPSGRFVSGGGMSKASRSDAFQMYLRRRHAAVPTFISPQRQIKVREVLP